MGTSEEVGGDKITVVQSESSTSSENVDDQYWFDVSGNQ